MTLLEFLDNLIYLYLFQVGYSGATAPLSDIDQESFSSRAMHANPEHITWDGYSGDYVVNFFVIIPGCATYLLETFSLGEFVVYGRVLTV